MRSKLTAALASTVTFVAGTAIAVLAPPTNAQAATSLACDIYAAGGTPCIGAHSTTRALFGAYGGPLYQVQRSSDRAFQDVGVLAPGGVANAATQDSFCANTSCTITKIYDQTANHNDLPISSGGFWKGPGPNGADIGADAKALPVTVGGQKAYGVKVNQGVGYRVDHAKGAPTGAQPEGIYMVTSSNYVNQWCCFDYGSGENSHTDTGNATMNAIEWGTACWFGNCVGSGPWVEADLENGMYHTGTGSNKDPNNPGVHFPFVSAWEKNNGTSNFTLKYGNATSGGLTTPYSGPLPSGYSPMKTDSSLLLGTGGDNSVSGVGEFFEGAITAGYPSDATENAVQADLTAAGYALPGGNSQGHQLVGGQSGRCADVPNSTTVNGTQVQLFDCSGSAGQAWTYTASKQLQVYGNKCLDASGKGTTNGTAAIIWDCNGQTNQQWNVNSNGTITGVQSGLCLDANGAATANGTKLILWSCNGGTNQQWSQSTTTPPPPPPPPPSGSAPCDIYASGGTPCVAAHSTTRALYQAYNGNLYQVRRSSDNSTRNIAVLSAGGAADAAAQDSFCAGSTCVITVVYDQSGHGNDMWYQGSSVVPGSNQSSPARATSESLTVGGTKAYSLYINPGNSYWRDGHLTGVPTGTAPEGIYMVTSGTHVNGGCCFDYGNSETTRKADAAGAMDAINFSTQCWFGGCSGSGPWVQADLEWGLYSGGSQSWNSNQRAFPNKFVTATLKNNGTSHFAMKGSNAQSGSLYTLWDGGLPGGYSPMKKQGAIILGSGGDCCKPGGGANLSAGTFYEGAVVAGYPSDATENAVQANIVAAGYR